MNNGIMYTKRYLNNEKQLHGLYSPAIVYQNGTSMWYFYGELHRVDGPAQEFHNGEKRWYTRNKLHRTDGPAIIHPDGSKKWYISGQRYTEKDFNDKIK